MVVPCLFINRFDVVKYDDGRVSLVIRRAFGFAVELVLQDSPLMYERLLTALEVGMGKSEIIDRMRAALEPPEPQRRRAPKDTRPEVSKGGPRIAASKGTAGRKKSSGNQPKR